MERSVVNDPAASDSRARSMLFSNASSLMADRGICVAIAFYAELLQRHPRMRRFFADSDLNRQATKIASMLRVIIAQAGAGRDMGMVSINLAISHASYGLTSSDYSNFTETLADVLAERQDVMDIDDAKLIWRAELSSIAEVMAILNQS